MRKIVSRSTRQAAPQITHTRARNPDRVTAAYQRRRSGKFPIAYNLRKHILYCIFNNHGSDYNIIKL